DAILERTPTGPGRGQRSARKARKVGEALGVKVATDGASPEVLHALGIPLEWAERCEDAAHVGHDGTSDSLALRLEWVRANQFSNFLEKISQLGSYGGGNHFGECEVVRLLDNDRARRVGGVFGLRDGCVGFLSHCGSRGFGHALASGQFRALQQKFATWNIPLPGEDKELVRSPSLSRSRVTQMLSCVGGMCLSFSPGIPHASFVIQRNSSKSRRRFWGKFERRQWQQIRTHGSNV